jgi:hypothetical protein
MQDTIYFLTALPALPSLGEKPPLRLVELRDRADDLPPIRRVIDAVLLEADLTQRRSILAGERDDAEPLVLSIEQIRGEAALEDTLRAEPPSGRAHAADVEWIGYFLFVHALGAQAGCGFLTRYAAFEIALRNALAVERARVLGVSADPYVFLEDLAEPGAEVRPIVLAWSGAADPLEAQRVVDQGRWQWLQANAGWYTFGLDEVAAYTRALLLLARWHRLVAA